MGEARRRKGHLVTQAGKRFNAVVFMSEDNIEELKREPLNRTLFVYAGKAEDMEVTAEGQELRQVFLQGRGA